MKKNKAKLSRENSKKRAVILCVFFFLFSCVLTVMGIYVLSSNKSDLLQASITSPSICKVDIIEKYSNGMKLKIECGNNVKIATLDGTTYQKEGNKIIGYKYITNVKKYVEYEWTSDLNIESSVKKYVIPNK